MRVNDGQPGVELQVDAGQMGCLTDPEDGRRRKVHSLTFTAVYLRHMSGWLSHAQTLAAVIAGCEAAWAFFSGVRKVVILDNLAGGHLCRAGRPAPPYASGSGETGR